MLQGILSVVRACLTVRRSVAVQACIIYILHAGAAAARWAVRCARGTGGVYTEMCEALYTALAPAQKTGNISSYLLTI